jgi:biopolymer transport protein ExbB
VGKGSYFVYFGEVKMSNENSAAMAIGAAIHPAAGNASVGAVNKPEIAMTPGFQFWTQGDLVSHLVLILLLLMSIYSWWIIVKQALRLRRINQEALAVERFWHSADYASALMQFKVGDNPFLNLVNTSQEATEHHRKTQTQLHDSLNASDWLTRSLHNSLDDAAAKLNRGLSVLASIGSTAPFVGLFGTVWGIYHALMNMGATQAPSLSEVAGPVGEALVMTAVGLAVAVPAVLGYNSLLRKQKSLAHALRRFAHDLHAYFLTGQRVADSSLVRS